jgi:hypothetical protein
MSIFKDLKEFYEFIENLEQDVLIDKDKNVWSENRITATFKHEKLCEQSGVC